MWIVDDEKKLASQMFAQKNVRNWADVWVRVYLVALKVIVPVKIANVIEFFDKKF